MKHVVVVGAGLAGVETVRVLREEGFAGDISLLGAEHHSPYDRPQLSKGFLTKKYGEEDLALDVTSSCELRRGTVVTALDPTDLNLGLDDGTALRPDAIVLATGATARTLDSGNMAGIHTLRTIDDARAIRACLEPGLRLVVVGGGFIGAEVAATARQLGLDVSILEMQTSLMLAQMGQTVSTCLTNLHLLNGVTVIPDASVVGFVGTDRVTGVQLGDGKVVAADIVLVGIGSVPATQLLDGSTVAGAGGIACDAFGRTAAPAIMAVGDCAAWWSEPSRRYRRRQHWSAALDQAGIAARTLVHGADAHEEDPHVSTYVWSNQYHASIQAIGEPGPNLNVETVEGSVDSDSFVVAYVRNDSTIEAVVALSNARQFGRWRRKLGTRLSD